MKKIWFLPGLFVSLIIIIFILAGMPFILNFVKNKIESAIQSQIGLPVCIGSLKGNLLYKVDISDFKIGEIVNINYLSVSYNILPVLLKNININSIMIDGLDVDLSQINSLTDNIKSGERKEAKLAKKPFEINIQKIVIINSNLGGVINKHDIKFSLNLRGVLSSQIFTIESLNIGIKKSNVSLKGDIPLTEDKFFAIQYSLYLVPEEFGIEGLSGNIQSRGNVKGKFLNPRISNNAQFSLNYQGNKISGSFNLNWKIPFLDSLDIDAHISAQTSVKEIWALTLKKKFTNLFAGIVAPYGNIRLPGSITGSFKTPKFKGQIQGKIKFAKFKPAINGRIMFQDSLLILENIRLKDKDFFAKLNGILNIAKSEIIKGNININCNDISIVNNFLKTPLPISGVLTINAQLNGKFDTPYITGKLSLHNAAIYNENINQANFNFRFKNAIAYLDQGLINSPRGTVCIKGRYGIKDNNFTGYIFSKNIKFESPEVFGKDTIPLSGNLGLEIEFYGNISEINGEGKIHLRDFVYDKWTFDEYVLEFAINNNTANINLLDLKNTLALDLIIQLNKPYFFNASLSLNHFTFGQYINLDEAYITLHILAKGNMFQPEAAEANIQIDSIYLLSQKNEIYNLEPLNIEIKDGLAYLHKAIIAAQNYSISFEGYVPLDKKYGEINLTVQAEHIQINSIYAMFSREQPPHGFFDLNLRIRGNLNAPQINGQLGFEKIGYALPGLVIDSVYGLIRFQENYFNIEYLRGKVNKGSFGINGLVQLNKSGIDTVAINLLLNKIDYTSNEFGSIILSGSAHLTTKKDIYNINSEITIDQAIYDKPFNLQTIVKLLTIAKRPAPEQNKILKQIYCDIWISSPNGIRIANNIADVGIDADLQIKGFLSKINVYGTVKTSSPGTVKYLGRKFDINSAVIQFDNPYQINPVLNLEANCSVSSRDGDYIIIMLLSGTIEKWYLQLSSMPPIPEQDIVSLLLIGRRRPGTYLITEARDINLTGAAKDYALGLVRGTLERTAEKSFGFEKFSITGDIFEPERWDIGFERKINKKLTLIYGTGIEPWEMRRIGINYTINNNFSIFTLHDQENMNSSVDLNLNFNLK